MPYRRLPSLLALRAFEAVSRNGSMKQAAEELSVTPGAVSQLVKKLEDQLQCELLTRINRGFELTEAGIHLKTGLSDSFNRMKEAVDSVMPISQSKTLIVACAPSFAAKWLVPRLWHFLETHPDVDIRISSSFSKLDYATKQIDIGVRLTRDTDSSMERLVIGEESLMVLASPEFIQRQKINEPKDILRVPILSEDISATPIAPPTWTDWFKKVGLPPKSANRGVNFGEYAEQALDAAIAGAGVVLGHKVLASKDIEQGRLVCPFGPEMKSGLNYQIVCRPQIKHSDAAIAFREWLTQELTQSLLVNALP